MENWGLVTYREVNILVDKAKSSIAQRMHVALVVAHELAHIWFGNLVTMVGTFSASRGTRLLPMRLEIFRSGGLTSG